MVFGVVACLVLAVGLVWPNVWIVWSTRKNVHATLVAVPPSNCVLVLGCAPRLTSGRDNSYFVARMAATAQLFAAGKVSRVLVSGGPLREPLVVAGVRLDSEADYMKAALVNLGIEAHAIDVDRHGVRTRLSIERAGTAGDKLTIVSQGFHTPRAVYLARRRGMTAHAFNASGPTRFSKSQLKLGAREVLSRARAFWEA